MTLIKQAVSNKNKNKGVNKSLSSMSKIKNTELKMNTPSRMLIRNRDNKFIKNDNKVTEKISEEEEINGEEELLNLVSNKHDEHRGDDVLNINETIKSQEKTDRSSNLQSTRVNKKIMRSRIPRRRPVVTANKLTGFHSVTRIVVVKKNSRKIKVPSDPIIPVTDKSDCEPVAGLVEELDDYKIPESPELSPLTRKVSLSSCNNNSYFDDDAGYFDDDTDSDIDNDNCEDDDTDGYDDDDNSDENSYDPSLHCESCINCACESCFNKYKQRAELLHQLKYKHWATNDVLKSARYQSLNSSEEEESSIKSSSSPVFEKKIYRKHTREVYTSPKKRQKQQLQEKNCNYSFLHIVFDIIFWPVLFFRKAK
ncbi:eisosome protein SEG2-like [Cotesia glomerata]|uniref:C2H2-type domain-containing protein n=1 Tax=Cotesia glomerata TaxID=32391 RepID=A0AAV7ITR9_COTGL|nr:eisosome protein SEG2-like [Cotesia glomerata]KAH0560142.1 hypothetical protein KQX54_001895 [Cotesia glomerata]